MRPIINLAASAALISLVHCQTNKTISISQQDTYLLPNNFSGNLSSHWYSSTKTSNASFNALLQSAQNATFIVYDEEFYSILGDNPQYQLAAERADEDFAYEGGAYAADRGEVWFSGDTEVPNGSRASVLHLANMTVETPEWSSGLRGVNGAYYFEGIVYYTTLGTNTSTPKVAAVDPSTKTYTTVLDSYFGLSLGPIDDITWVRRGGYAYMFITTLNTPQPLIGTPGNNNLLPNAIWRFDPQQQTLIPVIPRDDIQYPNGVRVNAAGTKLYVGDYSVNSSLGAYPLWGSPATFVYDLDAEMRPVNKRMFSMARFAGPDGLHLDDAGRVWLFEGDGIYVRNSEGKLLGVFNALPLVVGDPFSSINLANFALAGDTLVYLAHTRVWTLKLAKTIVAPGNLS